MSLPEQVATSDMLRELFWPDHSPIRRAIVLVIAVLLAFAVARSLGQLARLRSERAALRRVANRIDAWRDKGEPAPAGGEAPASGHASGERKFPRLALPELREKLTDLKQLAGRNTHCYAIVDALETQRTHQVRLNLEAMQQLAELREVTHKGASTAQRTAGLTILLGVLGTFWGLAEMVHGIHHSLPEAGVPLTAESLAASVQNVNEMLGGMRTAFATSLAGISAAIVCSWFGGLIRDNQAALLSSVSAFITNQLLPATVPTLDDDSMLEQISGQLERSFNHIDAIAQQNTKAIQDLSGLENVFRDIIKDVRAITSAEARQDFDAVLRQVTATNGAVQQVVMHMPRIADELRLAREAMVSALDSGPRSRGPGSLPPPPPPRLLDRIGNVPLVLIAVVLATALFAAMR